MASDDVLELLAEELSLALQPLVAAFASPDALRDFLETLGWDFPAAPDAVVALGAPLQTLYDLVNGTDAVPAGQQQSLLDSLLSLLKVIAQLASNPGLTDEFKNDFPGQLIDYLVFEYLYSRHRRIGTLLRLVGLLQTEAKSAAGDRPAYNRRIVDLQGLGKLFSDPLGYIGGGYSWGQSSFAGLRLLENAASSFAAWGVAAREQQVDDALLGNLNAGALQPGDAFVATLRMPLFESSNDPLGFSTGLDLFLLPETATAKPGLALLPYASTSFDAAIPLSDRIELTFDARADLTAGLGVLLRPGQGLDFLTGLGGGSPVAAAGSVTAGFKLVSGSTPFLLVGSGDASHFEIAGASTSAGARLDTKGRVDLFVEASLQQGKIVIKPGQDELDGFLATLLPADGMSISVDLAPGFSSSHGLYFAGSSGLEIRLPAHLGIGPIEIESAMVAIHFTDAGIPIDLTASVSADLSVLKAVLENVGVTANITFPPSRDGNLGSVDLALAFRPPDGVGLSVDAGVVKGGGYLYIDTQRGEYAGALELVVADWLQLTAIGLITTKMPDGSKGFSLLVIITADFGTGIQLGFGFTLIGVGGLLGLNRTMLFQPLMDGVRTGAINGILFPTDVVANAPKIISDLKAIFPPKTDTFLIGPMAKLGWGTPTLISASLGVIIEIPPADIAILGIIQLALPEPDDIILLLQVNFAGALEFDKKRLYFFASLYDSRILFITIQGEMGLLVAYGSDANFVLSVGGFHPQFNPPPLPFPSPNRVQLDIINESYARVRADGYFAVTSNTAQFGAHSEYFFGFSAVSVTGHSGFDALFQFSPFYFIVEGSTAFSANVFGVGVYGLDIDLTLSGPTPWHAHGTASISFLFFSIGIGIDITWGDSRDTSLPLIVVMSILVTEFGKSTNWRAQLPAGSNLLVSLRQLDPADTTLVLHPVGTLRVSQRAVPLDLTLDKVGEQAPSDANRFHLDVSSGGLARNQDLNEPFAPAQFRNFSDADKLSQAAYTPQHSGVELAAAGSSYATGTAITRNVRYELTVIDTQYRRYLKRFFVYLNSLFLHFLGGASVARNAFSGATLNQMQPWGQKVTVSGESFAVANLSDNRAYSAGSVGFSSRVSAQDFLNRTLAAQPSLTGSLHVLGQHELTP